MSLRISITQKSSDSEYRAILKTDQGTPKQAVCLSGFKQSVLKCEYRNRAIRWFIIGICVLCTSCTNCSDETTPLSGAPRQVIALENEPVLTREEQRAYREEAAVKADEQITEANFKEKYLKLKKEIEADY